MFNPYNRHNHAGMLHGVPALAGPPEVPAGQLATYLAKPFTPPKGKDDPEAQLFANAVLYAQGEATVVAYFAALKAALKRRIKSIEEEGLAKTDQAALDKLPKRIEVAQDAVNKSLKYLRDAMVKVDVEMGSFLDYIEASTEAGLHRAYRKLYNTGDFYVDIDLIKNEVAARTPNERTLTDQTSANNAKKMGWAVQPVPAGSPLREESVTSFEANPIAWKDAVVRGIFPYSRVGALDKKLTQQHVDVILDEYGKKNGLKAAALLYKDFSLWPEWAWKSKSEINPSVFLGSAKLGPFEKITAEPLWDKLRPRTTQLDWLHDSESFATPTEPAQLKLAPIPADAPPFGTFLDALPNEQRPIALENGAVGVADGKRFPIPEFAVPSSGVVSSDGKNYWCGFVYSKFGIVPLKFPLVDQTPVLRWPGAGFAATKQWNDKVIPAIEVAAKLYQQFATNKVVLKDLQDSMAALGQSAVQHATKAAGEQTAYQAGMAKADAIKSKLTGFLAGYADVMGKQFADAAELAGLTVARDEMQKQNALWFSLYDSMTKKAKELQDAADAETDPLKKAALRIEAGRRLGRAYEMNRRGDTLRSGALAEYGQQRNKAAANVQQAQITMQVTLPAAEQQTFAANTAKIAELDAKIAEIQKKANETKKDIIEGLNRLPDEFKPPNAPPPPKKEEGSGIWLLIGGAAAAIAALRGR